ncbi:hypothetical protein MC7420_7792 [Coleofasciculus chthonoplastes PCC 7420]|uniref:Uncharacterized protein n=1 Tax=Coleofasciculus chthonoplastes PCC 7420 TaxID=118168 RepID=B4VJF5_9CYAN|nr:hypothetical protein MC7420_7792 [Coleofasciculus chthonoplastes PCC 7420]
MHPWARFNFPDVTTDHDLPFPCSRINLYSSKWLGAIAVTYCRFHNDLSAE